MRGCAVLRVALHTLKCTQEQAELKKKGENDNERISTFFF